MFTFALSFTCIILPTYIYQDLEDFSSYAMDQYNHFYGSKQCNLTDPECSILNKPINQSTSDSNTCLNNPYLASSCCSLHTEAFFINSSSNKDWTKSLGDVIDGTVIMNIDILIMILFFKFFTLGIIYSQSLIHR